MWELSDLLSWWGQARVYSYPVSSGGVAKTRPLGQAVDNVICHQNNMRCSEEGNLLHYDKKGLSAQLTWWDFPRVGQRNLELFITMTTYFWLEQHCCAVLKKRGKFILMFFDDLVYQDSQLCWAFCTGSVWVLHSLQSCHVFKFQNHNWSLSYSLQKFYSPC